MIVSSLGPTSIMLETYLPKALEYSKKNPQRVWYIIVSIIYVIMFINQMMIINVLIAQNSKINSFLKTHVNESISSVCVLYGSNSIDNLNPYLVNHFSCKFVQWGTVLASLMLLFIIAMDIYKGIYGKAKM